MHINWFLTILSFFFNPTGIYHIFSLSYIRFEFILLFFLVYSDEIIEVRISGIHFLHSTKFHMVNSNFHSTIHILFALKIPFLSMGDVLFIFQGFGDFLVIFPVVDFYCHFILVRKHTLSDFK